MKRKKDLMETQRRKLNCINCPKYGQGKVICVCIDVNNIIEGDH